MITCKPQSICSWNYYLIDGDKQAYLQFNWLSEQGSITLGDIEYAVHKHGPLSGQWSLEQNGEPLIWAKKSNPVTRTIEVSLGDSTLTLRAESPIGRSFLGELNAHTAFTIKPVHLLTRRAVIETFGENLEFPTLCFAFWLVALMWRRSANNNNS
jgi:hypothetical protein